MGGVCGTHGGGEVHTGFWWGDLRKGRHLEDPVVDGRIILKYILNKGNGGSRTGLICPRMETRGAVMKAVVNLRLP
jgi:hypothetical protein